MKQKRSVRADPTDLGCTFSPQVQRCHSSLHALLCQNLTSSVSLTCTNTDIYTRTYAPYVHPHMHSLPLTCTPVYQHYHILSFSTFAKRLLRLLCRDIVIASLARVYLLLGCSIVCVRALTPEVSSFVGLCVRVCDGYARCRFLRRRNS
jgi:hypothetical protein